MLRHAFAPRLGRKRTNVAIPAIPSVSVYGSGTDANDTRIFSPSPLRGPTE